MPIVEYKNAYREEAYCKVMSKKGLLNTVLNSKVVNFASIAIRQRSEYVTGFKGRRWASNWITLKFD